MTQPRQKRSGQNRSGQPAAAYGPHNGMGLYVHWPYCARICPYCDFNVYAAKDRSPGTLVDALLADLAGHARIPGYKPAPLTSVFLGGGTPSLMPPDAIWSILGLAHQLYGLAEPCEVTLEANPADITDDALAAWRDAGVNRLSIGVQSLDDQALHFLGRDHDAATARRAVDAALKRVPSVSIDLIYARPGQSLAAWQAELGAGIALGAPHLSLYELTIEEKTAFGARARRGDLIPMPDDDQATLYEVTQAICDAAGLPAYEISNHAASPDHQSVHNLTYWRGGDWIGIGPGAHGRLTLKGQRIATEAVRKPGAYTSRIEQKGRGWQEKTVLTPLEAARERLAMGLRSAEGLPLQAIEALTGHPVEPNKLSDFQSAGLITVGHGKITLTPQGRLLADRITAELAP
ncbi:MAG: radical SAM family heme chaperone HemW [Pseudomonadota bacterium]